MRKYQSRVSVHGPIQEAKRILRSKDPGRSEESRIWALRALWRHGQLDVSTLSDTDKLLVTVDNKRK